MQRIAIVGGGLTGLAAAYQLQRESARRGGEVSFRLYERRPEWGGVVRTERRDGFLLEGGPDSFITRKPALIQLVRELGLEERVLSTPESHRRVSVLKEGALIPLPAGMVLAVPTDLRGFLRSPLLSPAGRLRTLLDMARPARRSTDDESLAAFLLRRFGREALEWIGVPLMAGIHSAAPETLSLQATFPQFAAVERRFGSVIRGLRAAASAHSHAQLSARVTLAGGMGELVETLVGRLPAEALRSGRGVQAILRGPAGYSLELEGGESEMADAVILAVPAPIASPLLASTEPDLSLALRRLRYVTTATISLGFERRQVRHPLDGLGFVVPRLEARSIRACTWSSSKFTGRAPEDAVLLRAYTGGAGLEGFLEADDDELVAWVLRDAGPLLGISGAPILTRVHRFEGAVPQYDVGHLERVRALEASCPPGLILAGGSYHGVGLPDCVKSGRDAAAQALEALPTSA